LIGRVKRLTASHKRPVPRQPDWGGLERARSQGKLADAEAPPLPDVARA